MSSVTLVVSPAEAQSKKREPSTATAHSIYGTPEPMPHMSMPLVAPVFLETDQIDSTITVVNGITIAAGGTVTLRDQQGNIIAKQAMTFAPHSSTPVALRPMLAAAGSLAHSGSVTLEQDAALKGPALLAQLSMTMHTGSQAAYLEEEFGMPTTHGSAVLRGVASRTKNLPLVAITSVSEVSQTIHASCVGENSSDTSIELAAYGTAVVQACTWRNMPDLSLGLSSSLQSGMLAAAADHAISLQTDSVPGAFYAFGLALNAGIGQAQLQPVDFYDPGLTPSSSIVYVGVPLGSLALVPSGLSVPVVTLANFSGQPRTTTVTLADSSSGTPKVQQVAQITTPAHSTQTITLSGVTANGILNTFTITSDGRPADMQAHLFTRLGTSERRTEMLAKDPRDDHNGGDHPWSIDGGNSATVLLYNPLAKPESFEVHISGGGDSWLQMYTLQPNETKSISINDIVHKGIPDHSKIRLHSMLTSGEVQWHTSFGASGLGRILVSNSNTGLMRSFSCEEYYNLCYASLSPQDHVNIAQGQIGSIYSINPVVCTEYSPSSCDQTSPSSEMIDFSTDWQNIDSEITSATDVTNTYVELQGIAIGSFSIEAIVSAGACEAAPLGGGGNVYPTIMLSSGEGNTRVDGTTQIAVVGQQITLMANYTLPSGSTANSIQWSVPGTTVGGFNPTNNTGQATNSDFTGMSTTFYWVDSTTSARTVMFSVSLSDGSTQSSTVMFNVEGPTNVNITAVTGTVNVSSNNQNLVFGGTLANTGITIDGAATRPNDYSGAYSWVQLITSTTVAKPTSGNNYTCNYGPGLDSQYPYDTGTEVDDNPSTPLLSSFVEETDSDSFTTYLMWTPDDVTSPIAVPLGSVSWGWFGDATQNTATGLWSLKNGNVNSPQINLGSTYPNWTQLVDPSTNQGGSCQ